MKTKVKSGFIYDPSLVLFLPLYELDGASFMSKDAYGHLCTVTDATWEKQGRSFDGTGDVITVPDHASLDFGTGEFTVEMWIWHAVIGVADKYRELIIKLDGDTGWRFNTRESGGKFHIYAKGGGANATIILSKTFETWLHFAFMRRSGELGGYCDCEEGDYWRAGAADMDNAEDITIGAGGTQPDFEGVIGEVRIYNRPLTYIEVCNNYQATKWRYK